MSHKVFALMRSVGRSKRGLLVLNTFGVFAGLQLLAKVGIARRLTIRLMILSIRAVTPLACLLVLRNGTAAIRSVNSLSLRRLLWYAASVWSLAEVAFLVYLNDYWRALDKQSTRRWRAILTHSTEEKRRASMERYLLMIAQVSRGGSDGATDATGLVEFTNKKNRARRRNMDSGTLVVQTPLDSPSGGSGLARPLSSMKHSRHGSFGSFGQISTGMAQMFSSGNLLNGLSHGKREASVNDMLEHLSKSKGSNKADSSSQALNDDEFQRLKTLEFTGWFHGPDKDREVENPEAWLRRGNVEDWIAHFWFRGATPQELSAQAGGSEELGNLVDMVLDFIGLNLAPGRNPNICPHLMMSDPLAVLHRPLIVYVGSSLICPFMTYQFMRYIGFKREWVGGLSYWHRTTRKGIGSDVDLAGPRQIPLVFLHGLGVGLVPYYFFIQRLAARYSGEIFVPDLTFLAMMPWERVPSAREVVAQIQDMLAAHHHPGAHFVGHSFGSVMLGWVMKMSPSSIILSTFIEPAAMLSLKSDLLTRVLWEPPATAMYAFLRYFVFRELFTVNLLCRCSFWEQTTLWPEEITTPAVVELASEDAVVSSLFVRRLLEHERAARKHRKRLSRDKRSGSRKNTLAVPSGSSQDVHGQLLAQREALTSEASLDILWTDGFIHGQILFHRKQTVKLFSKMKQMVQDAHS